MNQAIKRILFATDFSEGAGWAQHQAALWAKQCKAVLDVLHILELQPGMSLENPVLRGYLDSLRKQADQQLDEMVKAMAETGLRAQSRVEVGIPSQAIQEMAKEFDSDLVILGTRGLGGMEHILVGSTAERVMRMAPCPVLTVREPAQPEGTAAAPKEKRAPRYRNILVPVDFSDCSLEALEYAIQVAKGFDAALLILHVLEPVSFGLDFTLRQVEERHQMRLRREAWLNEVQTACTSQGLKAEHTLIGGTPVDSILTHTHHHVYDLIVMGTHGRRGITHFVCGSVAEALVRRAPCPVLTVKSPKFAHGHQRVLPTQRDHVTEPLTPGKEAHGIHP